MNGIGAVAEVTVCVDVTVQPSTVVAVIEYVPGCVTVMEDGPNCPFDH